MDENGHVLYISFSFGALYIKFVNIHGRHIAPVQENTVPSVVKGLKVGKLNNLDCYIYRKNSIKSIL